MSLFLCSSVSPSLLDSAWWLKDLDEGLTIVSEPCELPRVAHKTSGNYSCLGWLVRDRLVVLSFSSEKPFPPCGDASHRLSAIRLPPTVLFSKNKTTLARRFIF